MIDRLELATVGLLIGEDAASPISIITSAKPLLPSYERMEVSAPHIVYRESILLRQASKDCLGFTTRGHELKYPTTRGKRLRVLNRSPHCANVRRFHSFDQIIEIISELVLIYGRDDSTYVLVILMEAVMAHVKKPRVRSTTTYRLSVRTLEPAVIEFINDEAASFGKSKGDVVNDIVLGLIGQIKRAYMEAKINLYAKELESKKDALIMQSVMWSNLKANDSR